jgi:hypothetical protein
MRLLRETFQRLYCASIDVWISFRWKLSAVLVMTMNSSFYTYNSNALQLVSCGLRANAVCSQQRDAFGRCVGAAAAARAIPCADQARPCH